ncbi:hypothetical protein [Phenylobacterium sp.]|uniref:hypothetical protein n=1 Tax=Phenylobacterium sp. TaxID=1871053 RepID=UPI002632B9D7|nr:hypothetical protein [Phenylobacterium sp.]
MPSKASYNHESVALDGETFAQCEFRACRLIYSGGEPPRFDDCRFEDCEWKLAGPAALTLTHLRGMWNAGAKAPVQAMIKEITGTR